MHERIKYGYIILLVTYNQKDKVFGYSEVEIKSDKIPVNDAKYISYALDVVNKGLKDSLGDNIYVDMYGYIDANGEEVYWETDGTEISFT